MIHHIDEIDPAPETALPRRAGPLPSGDLARRRRLARLTGLAYLVMGVAGMLGFLVIRSQLHVPGDAAETASRLVGNEGLARFGLVADLVLVSAQCVTAVGFYALFRPVDAVAAGSLAGFGFMNSAAIMVGTMCSATALLVALGGTGVGGGADTVLVLSELGEAAWSVGALFFGLWLLPMGWLVLASGWLPRPLGWVLIVGGGGYVVSAVIDQLAPDASIAIGALAIPATIGEFWIIGYLLLRGVGAEPSRS